MSGGYLPYHLRPNKAIERAVFIEFLSKANRLFPIIESQYIGLGGIHLEDFRILHSTFGMTDMLSIEENADIHHRQEFNKPIACIDCKNKSSDSFIAEFERRARTIAWLDYTSPRQIGSQLREYMALLEKMENGDILKITLNANAKSLYDPSSLDKKLSEDEVNKLRLEKFRARLAELSPEPIKAEMMNTKKYPGVLVRALQQVTDRVFNGSNLLLHPVTSFMYADSENRMLTLTGVVLRREEVHVYEETCQLSKWEFYNPNWVLPQIINIPDLTLKERMAIDSLLPSQDDEHLTGKLRQWFSEGEIPLIKEYVRFYRHFPHYSKIVI